MGRLCKHGKLKCRECKERRRVPAAVTMQDIEAAAARGRLREEKRIAEFIYTAVAECPPADCPVFGCQLSAGHPPPHCLPAAGGRYQMVDDNGNILREL
jgi:hypothetical protein